MKVKELLDFIKENNIDPECHINVSATIYYSGDHDSVSANIDSLSYDEPWEHCNGGLLSIYIDSISNLD